jgi:thiosulfate/3-mercaptopyruvate sulfurtransferase
VKILTICVLDGVFSRWLEEGRPVTTEPGFYPPGNLSGIRRPELFVSKEDVLKAINDENVIIIDSLSEASYKGEANTY